MANALMPIPILNNYKTIVYRYREPGLSGANQNFIINYSVPADINNTIDQAYKVVKFMEITDAITGEELYLAYDPINQWSTTSMWLNAGWISSYLNKPIHIRLAIAQKIVNGQLDKPTDTTVRAWINNNSDYISHWSNTQVTICADSYTPAPILTASIDSVRLTDNTKDGIVTDYISSAIFTIAYGGKIIATSPRVYATDNSISWRPNLTGYEGKTLTSTSTYTTNLGTVGTCSTDFSVPEPVVNSNMRVTVTLSGTDGALQINATNVAGSSTNPICLERKCQEKNEAWERIYTKTSSSSTFTYKDYTYDSSHSYQYRVYREKDLASSGAGISSIVYAPLEDMQLMNNQGSLVIKFNPQLTGMKYSVTDAILNPLGAQYPIVRRNGAQNYRTFTLGGLISYETEAGANALSLLNTANIQSLTFASAADEQYYKERIFRERVLQFLHDDTVKLLRTPSEGNMLVRLTNVSLTPNQQLGNMLYTFSATCTEIAAPTEDNYKKYDVIPPQ